CEEAGIRILRKGAREGPRIARVDRQRAPDRPTEIDQVDEQVVEREQQESDAREQRELGRGAAEDLRQRHRATPKLENPSESVSCRSVHDSLPTRRIIQNRASATIHNQRGIYPLDACKQNEYICVMAQSKAPTLRQFQDRFPTEDSCLDHLFQVRYAGTKCPKCDRP